VPEPSTSVGLLLPADESANNAALLRRLRPIPFMVFNAQRSGRFLLYMEKGKTSGAKRSMTCNVSVAFLFMK